MTRHRLQLYGKKVTQDDILEEIYRLLYGKGDRPYPIKPSEIAKVIDLSRYSVYNYIKKLSQRGDLAKLPSGHLALPQVDEREFRMFNKHHEITSDPLVSEWMDDLLTRRRGLPIKSWRIRLCSVEVVCNTCKVTPSELIISTKQTEKIMREFAAADKFIKERWGLDSDVYRWFWIGVESCARFNALYNMKNDWTKIKRKSGAVFLMSVIESKTEDIRGGKWTKYITRPDTQKSLELLKERNCDRIFESKLAETPFKKMITQNISEIYTHLGKTEPYFHHHPSHALRHLGAHYWLAKTDYNYGIIAEVGGWHTIDELKKSYGQIPPEKILEIIN